MLCVKVFMFNINRIHDNKIKIINFQSKLPEVLLTLYFQLKYVIRAFLKDSGNIIVNVFIKI